MDKYFTVEEIPTGEEFQIRGSSVILVKQGRMEVMITPGQFIDPIDYGLLIRVGPETKTQTVRPFFKIDPTQVIASFANIYLMRTPDGYVIETFDEAGRVHFEQYFRPTQLHRALSALQAQMPQPIPEWAMTEITRPCGATQFTTNNVCCAIADVFFVGYGERLNSVEKMERILNTEGYEFNDLTQEVCFNPET